MYTLASHVNYWSSQPGTYHHPLHLRGLHSGWSDAELFIHSNVSPRSGNAGQGGVSQLGFVEWAMKGRREEVGGGGVEGVWEFGECGDGHGDGRDDGRS